MRLIAYCGLIVLATSVLPNKIAAGEGVIVEAGAGVAVAAPHWDLPRNFDAVYPRKDVQMDYLAGKYAPDYLMRPWYLAPYRNYAWYRPWYSYGAYYGPRWYPYHYAPSAGYVQPWYGPQYLNPRGIAAPTSDQLYHW